MPIVTGPGEEFQFDWSDCNTWARRWGWDHELHCFGTLLCWSRMQTLVVRPTRSTRPTPLRASPGSFDDIGGVPGLGRTDRMGQLGQSHGVTSFVWHPIALEFARHYGFALKACDAGDAARKGKIERPFRDLKAGFLAEIDLDPPADIAELNRRAVPWLAALRARGGARTTKVPTRRTVRDRGASFAPATAVRFDTARRRAPPGRPLPADRVGHGVLLGATGNRRRDGRVPRSPSTAGSLELRFAGRLVATHRLAPAGSEPQWLPEHHAADRSHRHGPPRPTASGRRVPNPDRGAAGRCSISASATTTSSSRPRRLRADRPAPPTRCGGRYHRQVLGLRLHRRRDTMSTTTLIEQIKDDLGYLKLHRSAEVFATLAAEAEAPHGPTQFLAALVAEEAAATRQRRLNARLRFAHFPDRRTIDEFDFDFQPSIDPSLVDDLAALDFVARRDPDPAVRQPRLREDPPRGRARHPRPSRPATAATSPPPPTWSRP